LARADGATFMLPEVDDEVLIAFAHGDPARPFVVGSLWDSGDRPPEERTCPSDHLVNERIGTALRPLWPGV
jgi:type VI secretion system (T6SS) baseplate-like injector VgrG